MKILFLTTVLPLLVATSPAVIANVQKDEIPQDFYDRVKKIPVNEVTQELFSDDDILSINDITKVVDENPLLQDMPMFKSRQNGVKQNQPAEPVPFDEEFGGSIRRAAVTDNFDEEYRKVNETLFHLAIPMDAEIEPTGRSLADDGPPPEFSEELMTTDTPFAVTESLLSSLASIGESLATTPVTTPIPRPVFSIPPVSPPVSLFESAADMPSGNSLENGSFEDISHGTNRLEPTGMAASYFKGVSDISTPPSTTHTPASYTVIPTLSPIEFQEVPIVPPIPNHFQSGFEGVPAPVNLENNSGLNQNELPSGGSEEMGETFENNILMFEREVVRDRERTTLSPPPARPEPPFLLVKKPKAVREMKIKNGLPESVFRGFFYPDTETIRHLADGKRVDEDKVMKTAKGKFRVSATKYYLDNRVESDVMVEDYKPRRASVELMEMMEDPRYLIETEVSQLRAHGQAMRHKNRAISRGIKTASGSPITSSDSELTTRKKLQKKEKDPPTIVKMSVDNGRPVEHRSSLIGGKMVNVTLANMLLHGHDYIVWPGSYINGKMPYTETAAPAKNLRNMYKTPVYETTVSSNGAETSTAISSNLPKQTQVASSEIDVTQDEITEHIPSRPIKDTSGDCFQMYMDTTLKDAKPFERRIANKPDDCLRICAVVKGCLSVVYANRLSICDVFAVRPGEEGSRTEQLKGTVLYTPRRPDMRRCMAIEDRTLARGVSTQTEEELLAELAIQPKSTQTSGSVVSSASNPRCSRGEAVMLMRTDGYRNPRGSNMDTMYDISEDDCLYACLTNSGIDSQPLDCTTAQYLENKQQCILSNGRQKLELEPAKGYMFYEKICIEESAVHQCSGGTVERIPQSVLVGYLREAKITSSVSECLSICVNSRATLGFKCISVMYYYDEKVNCILNDASAHIDPQSLVTEEPAIHVDYFGIQECFGIPNAPLEGGKRKLKNLISDSSIAVEDDVRSGEITNGSTVHDAPKRKRVKRRKTKKVRKH